MDFHKLAMSCFAVDTEKINKSFSVLNDLIIERKRLFSDYNGDYFDYCKHSGKVVPLIVFHHQQLRIIRWNNTHGRYEEEIVRYTREGRRYGIIIIITASTSAHGFPSRIMRNLNNVFRSRINR